jgi:hypothetical protein
MQSSRVFGGRNFVLMQSSRVFGGTNFFGIFLEFFDQFFFAGTGFSEGGGLGK